MADDDKRRDCRLEKNFRVEIREFRFPLAKQPSFEVRCADISAGGCSWSAAAGSRWATRSR
jgi:hypothetical protein